MTRFFDVHLRTTDVDAARAFYAAVLGDTRRVVFPLHEQAIARGARPHWLGYLEVDDVEGAAAAFVKRGATPLGPKWVNPAGLEAAVLRDPGGAVVAVGKPKTPAQGSAPGVVWYALNTNEVEGAKRDYAELFGFDVRPAIDFPGHGVFHPFAWERGGDAVGVLGDVAPRPGVHPHWLFHFGVAAFDRAVETVRALGGLVVGPHTLPGGERIAVCDDPQGAAFGLRSLTSS